MKMFKKMLVFVVSFFLLGSSISMTVSADDTSGNGTNTSEILKVQNLDKNSQATRADAKTSWEKLEANSVYTDAASFNSFMQLPSSASSVAIPYFPNVNWGGIGVTAGAAAGTNVGYRVWKGHHSRSTVHRVKKVGHISNKVKKNSKTIDLGKFKGEGRKKKGPKGYTIEKDPRGGTPNAHGGSYWKLRHFGKRVATLSRNGKILRS